jgi:hypothetical protein
VTERLHPGDVELIAQRTAELVAERFAPGAAAGVLVDVKATAAALGVAPSFVYEHADELGAVRLGDGPRARLRFDIEQARQAMMRRTEPPVAPVALPRRQRKSRTTTSSGVPLLPIRGNAA